MMSYPTPTRAPVEDLYFGAGIHQGMSSILPPRLYAHSSRPRRTQTLLATGFNQYEKGPLLFDQLQTLLGMGVFNSDGAHAVPWLLFTCPFLYLTVGDMWKYVCSLLIRHDGQGADTTRQDL